MSDFLTRLAQRSLGELPALRPRLPGLFGPSDEPLSINATNTVAVTDAPQVMVAPSPSLRSGATPRAGPVPNEPKHARAGTPRQPEPSAVLAAASLSSIARTEQGALGNLIANVETMRTNTLAPLPLVTQTAPTAAAPWRSSSEPFDRNPRAALPAQGPPLLPQRAAKTTASPPAPADRAASADNRASAEPAVHITIGRIEVRANMATAPPAPRTPTRNKPALSLDDYLKRGGGRR